MFRIPSSHDRSMVAPWRDHDGIAAEILRQSCGAGNDAHCCTARSSGKRRSNGSRRASGPPDTRSSARSRSGRPAGRPTRPGPDGDRGAGRPGPSDPMMNPFLFRRRSPGGRHLPRLTRMAACAGRDHIQLGSQSESMTSPTALMTSLRRAASSRPIIPEAMSISPFSRA
jgi:hypothetical protein